VGWTVGHLPRSLAFFLVVVWAAMIALTLGFVAYYLLAF
jgi:hypothetical protein